MAWSDEPEGQDFNNAYEAMVNLYQNTLPDKKNQLDNLANRPITG